MKRWVRVVAYLALWVAAFGIVLFLAASASYGQGRPRPVSSGRSSARCAPYHDEAFILCAEGWKPDHGKLREIRPCEPHRAGSQFWGPYGMGSVARAKHGGCDRKAALSYLRARYHGSWSEAEQHHRRKDWW